MSLMKSAHVKAEAHSQADVGSGTSTIWVTIPRSLEVGAPKGPTKIGPIISALVKLPGSIAVGGALLGSTKPVKPRNRTDVEPLSFGSPAAAGRSKPRISMDITKGKGLTMSPGMKGIAAPFETLRDFPSRVKLSSG